jgi:hypothetical protein
MKTYFSFGTSFFLCLSIKTLHFFCKNFPLYTGKNAPNKKNLQYIDVTNLFEVIGKDFYPVLNTQKLS